MDTQIIADLKQGTCFKSNDQFFMLADQDCGFLLINPGTRLAVELESGRLYNFPTNAIVEVYDPLKEIKEQLKEDPYSQKVRAFFNDIFSTSDF